MDPAGISTLLRLRVDAHGQEGSASRVAGVGVALGGDAELVQAVVEVLGSRVEVALIADVDAALGDAVDRVLAVDLVLRGLLGRVVGREGFALIGQSVKCFYVEVRCGSLPS